jgi:hypothetical protein
MINVRDFAHNQMLIIDKVLHLISDLDVVNQEGVLESLLSFDQPSLVLRQFCLVLNRRCKDLDNYIEILSHLLKIEGYKSAFLRSVNSFPSSILRRLFDLNLFTVSEITSTISVSTATFFFDVIPELQQIPAFQHFTKQWIYSGIAPNTVTYTIFADDVDALSALPIDAFQIECPRPDFMGTLRPFDTLIDAAALFRSVRCFRFLMLTDAKVTTMTMEYAVKGGSAEIFRLCEQRGIDLRGMADVAAEFFRFDILDWFAEIHGIHGFAASNVATHLALSRERFEVVANNIDVLYLPSPFTLTFFIASFPELFARCSYCEIEVPEALFADFCAALLDAGYTHKDLLKLEQSPENILGIIRGLEEDEVEEVKQDFFDCLFFGMTVEMLEEVRVIFGMDEEEFLESFELELVISDGNEALAMKMRDRRQTITDKEFSDAVGRRFTKFVATMDFTAYEFWLATSPINHFDVHDFHFAFPNHFRYANAAPLMQLIMTPDPPPPPQKINGPPPPPPI